MISVFRIMAVGLLFIGLPTMVNGQSSKWALDMSASSLTFTGTQMGGQFDGRFGEFSADIHFDPETPAAGRVEVVIQTASVDTGGGDRDTAVVSKDFFHVTEFPTASFKLDAFAPSADGGFVATGSLTMKGVTHPIELPVKIAFTGDPGARAAHATGELTVSRLDFNIGEGQWKDTSVVGEMVTIRFDIMATESP